MLLCAGILGRYYSDWHDVDEEFTVIPYQGSMWNNEVAAGITLRNLWNLPDYFATYVASRQNSISLAVL